MKLLYGYLKPYKWLIVLTMLLATVNTVFSLIDPIIFGRIIKLSQDINTRQENGNAFGWDEFFSATMLLLLMSMGTAMVSRIAKNLQDYFANVHYGRPRKDCAITPLHRTVTKEEVDARLGRRDVLYVQNDKGEYIPVWRTVEF